MKTSSIKSSLVVCAVGLAAASCTGNIGDPVGGPSDSPGQPGTGTGAPPANPPAGTKNLDVNRVPVHKLNNTEYDNTIRDLTGVTTTMARTFIADETLYGFDNIAEAFGMTDAQFEQYYNAAEAIADQVFASDALRARIMTCLPASASDTACLTKIVGDFGARAWRRPLVDADTTRLVRVATDAIAAGEDATGGVKEVVKSILASAPFLYRVEADAHPASLAAHAVDGYELASRLSYLGWSTMPDARLFDLARTGELLKGDVLSAELDRLLADPRAQNFVSAFAGQWLGMRDLGGHQVDATVFPDWNEPLRQAMVQEGLLYFNEFLGGNGNPPAGMTEFFSRDVNFVSAPLAKLYGATGTFGVDPARTTLPSDTRVGFMGLAGFLTFSSFSYRTAPTLRGKWVLENLLCQDIPSPPANVPKLDDPNAGSAALQSENVRTRLEAHRAMPGCASCHTILDPIGLGLENFDATGHFRSKYPNGDAIDSSGVLPDGTTFANLKELAAVLSKPGDARLTECASAKLMTFALSRQVVDSDRPYLQQIRDSWKGGNLRDLLKQIVLNDTFRFRRGEAM
jgi:hypothetical protein